MSVTNGRLIELNDGAKPTAEEIRYMANEIRFLRSELGVARELADGLGALSRDPDGEVSVDFVAGNGDVFTMSVGPSGSASVAWAVSGNNGCCTAQLSPFVFVVLDAKLIQAEKSR